MQKTNQFGGRFVPVKDKLQSDIFDASHSINNGVIMIGYDKLESIITAYCDEQVKEARIDELGALKNSEIANTTLRRLRLRIDGRLAQLQQSKTKVDRFEVIDDSGRAYVKGSIYGTPVSVELSYQDDGKTLKVFVTEQSKTKEGK